ncbi:MAG: hypothetical protein V4506_16645 [Bacteroidota bacterium]
MKTILFSLTLFFLTTTCFGQFKHEQNSSGDPLSEKMDPNGMKQGNWNYMDSNNSNFRTENYKDNTLVSNLYKANAKSVDVSAFKQKNINSFSQKEIKDLATTLSAIGNGEIVILNDNTVSIHFYFDKIKNKAAIAGVKVDNLKKYALQKTIIFF